MAVDYDVYYLALSALQKCVRRGDLSGALRFAKAAWLENSLGLHSRLFTILFEDCGRDLSTLKAFSESSFSHKDLDAVLHLVGVLARSGKSHDSFGASWYVCRRYDYDSIPEKYSKLDYLRERWSFTGLDTYDSLGIPESLSWMPRFLGVAARYDRESLSPAAMYLSAIDCTSENSFTFVDECGEAANIDGFPLFALDKHTRPGLHILSLLADYLTKFSVCTLEDLGMYVFLREGCYLKNKMVSADGVDFWQMLCDGMGWGKYVSGKILDIIPADIFHQLDLARAHILTTKYASTLRKLNSVVVL
jgi:hypothetical protein